MALRKSEFIFILLTVGIVFFMLGFWAAHKEEGKTYTVTTEYSSFSPAASYAEQPGKLNINTATAEELLSLPGITEKLAGDIISFREYYGHIDYIERLLRVDGINRELFLEIEQYIYAG